VFLKQPQSRAVAKLAQLSELSSWLGVACFISRQIGFERYIEDAIAYSSIDALPLWKPLDSVTFQPWQRSTSKHCKNKLVAAAGAKRLIIQRARDRITVCTVLSNGF